MVLIRDAEGEWSLPQFITLSGGSVGWQAGVQGSDVILVFTTKKSVIGLLQGKFTIGADAAAAAGPVGRNAAAATDLGLQAEILSYSRSRGLFLGVSIDGSVLEIDEAAHEVFYGSPSSQVPRMMPQSAARLRQDLVNLTPVPVAYNQLAGATAVPAGPQRMAPPNRLPTLRATLDQNSRQLMMILSPEWQKYLAMPREVYTVNEQPRLDVLTILLSRYERVAKSTDYRSLNSRPEFQATWELLREYTEQIAAANEAALNLPPPPGS